MLPRLIDGVYTDYKIPNPFTVEFAHSMYNVEAKAASASSEMRTASTTEWNGKGYLGKKTRKKEL